MLACCVHFKSDEENRSLINFTNEVSARNLHEITILCSYTAGVFKRINFMINVIAGFPPDQVQRGDHR